MAVPEDDYWECCKDHINRCVECTGDIDQRHDGFVRDAFSFECVDEQVGWAATTERDKKNKDDAVKGVDSGRDVYQAALPFDYHDPEEEDC